MEIKLAPRKLVVFSGMLMLLLLVLHILSFIPVWFGERVYPLGPFCFDVEHNLPSFFSTALLVAISLLTACIAKGESDRRKTFQWAVLAVVFFLMAIDENTEIHEKLNGPIQSLVVASGIFYYSWIIAYLLLVVIFVAFYFRFFLQLPRDTRRRVVLAAALYVGGAIGMEMIDGAWYESFGQTPFLNVATTIEELMEMSGCIVFIHAFSSYIDEYMPNFRIRITSS